MRTTSYLRKLRLLGFGALAIVGCSAPDPGTDVYTGLSARAPKPTGSFDAGTAPPTSVWVADAGVGQADASAPSSKGAAASGVADAGRDGGGRDFLGSSAPFESKPVATSAREHHKAAAAIVQQPNTNCVACHASGGTAVPFLAAGFIATQGNGQIGAPDVEVRVWSTASKGGTSTHTDDDGFYWIKPPAAPLAAPFKAGVRNATLTKLMPGEAPGGACNSSNCHGGNLGSISLP